MSKKEKHSSIIKIVEDDMMNIIKNSVVKYVLTIVIFAAAALLVAKSSVLREMLYLIFISFLIAYTLKPIEIKMVNAGVNKKVSAIIIIGILILLVVSTFALLIPSLFKESLKLNATAANIQMLIDKFYAKLKLIQGNRTIHLLVNNLNRRIDSEIASIFVKIFDFLMNMGENILYLVVIPIITYYFLADDKCINESLLSAFPVNSRKPIKKICCHADKILGRYIASQIMLSALVGIATFFILIFLKVEFPIILSILNAFFNIIPYFGPIFGALPAIVIALTKSPETALWTAVWLYLLQQIEGNILSPKVTGDSIDMHPLIVILLLIVGGKISGFIGMVLAVPFGVLVKVIYEDLNYYMF
ncbi:AI-2E family transporter [Clostridium autoethanogenum]|nr:MULTISPECIES: AI-2E family transporter [Clostridium]AGY77499.2 AI-2E family transporter [Clostridium autoethanogenum DSM 10061]